MRQWLHILVLWAGLFSPSVHAVPAYITFPSDVNWVTRQSEHFQIIYRLGQEPLAELALAGAERAYKLLVPIFPEVPDKTWIVLSDFHDSTNGYALTFPYPHMVIFAAPPDSIGTLASLDNWLDSVILHEFVHILHLYPTDGLWAPMKSIFGTWVVPNGFMPSHFHEGLAVLLETEKSLGGRGRGTDFKMLKRMAVAEGVWGTDQFFARDLLDGTVSRFPHGAAAYFFGSEMYKELWSRKGPEGINQLVTSYSSNWPYLLDGPLKEVYGVTYPTLWEEVFNKTRGEMQKEIAKIKSEKLSPITSLTQNKFNKWDVTLSPDKKRLAYRSWDPEMGGFIRIWDVPTKQVTHSFEMNGAAQGMCWGKHGDREYIFFIDPESSNNTALNFIKVLDPQTSKQRILNGKGVMLNHLHRLSCDPTLSTLLIYKESAGDGFVKELKVSFEPDDKYSATESRSWKVPTGDWITSVLVGSPHIFGVRHRLTTSFYRWGSSGEPMLVTEADGLYHQFRAGPAGQLLAIGDIDGREEIWSLDLNKKEASKKVALLGGTNSFDNDGNSLLFTNYSHGGFDLAASEPKDLKKVPLPAAQTYQDVPGEKLKIGPQESYSAFETLVPKTWVPQLLFVPDGLQFGIWVPAFDIAQRHYYNLIAGYDTRGLPFAQVDYVHRFGPSYFVNADVYYAPSYIQSRKEFFKRWGATITLGGSIDPIPPNITLSTIFRRVEATGTLPERQSIGFQLGLNYSFGGKRRPLSISPIKGTTLGATYAYYLKALGSTENYFSATASVDQFVEAPWIKEHVWYLGLRGGYTEGTPLYNNYFEGGGELLFSQGRGVFLNRGFYPGTFLARRILNLTLEYKFPIAIIERGWGYTPLSLKSVHAALVADATTFDYGPFSSVRQNILKIYYMSAGAELKTDWTLGFYLPGQLRFGAYHGFGPFGETLYFTVGAQASL